jgi:hypothetical protein
MSAAMNKKSLRIALITSLLLLTSSIYAATRTVTVCANYPTSTHHQASSQGVAVSQLRIRIDNQNTFKIRQDSVPICKTFNTSDSSVSLNLSCNWQSSSSVKNNTGERGNCTFSGNNRIILFNNSTQAKRNKPICITASIQKHSRSCRGANVAACITINTATTGLSRDPLLFEMKKFHNTNASTCRGLSKSNTT